MIISLHTFSVIFFAWYKEYYYHLKNIIWWISFTKCSDKLPALTCARAIGNLWSIYLGVSILSSLIYFSSGIALFIILQQSLKETNGTLHDF